jgi:hypothetical protein
LAEVNEPIDMGEMYEMYGGFIDDCKDLCIGIEAIVGTLTEKVGEGDKAAVKFVSDVRYKNMRAVHKRVRALLWRMGDKTVKPLSSVSIKTDNKEVGMEYLRTRDERIRRKMEAKNAKKMESNRLTGGEVTSVLADNASEEEEL